MDETGFSRPGLIGETPPFRRPQKGGWKTELDWRENEGMAQDADRSELQYPHLLCRRGKDNQPKELSLMVGQNPTTGSRKRQEERPRMTEALEWLLTEQNAPFIFALLVSAIFMAVQMFFGFSDAIDIAFDGLDAEFDAEGGDGDAEFGGHSIGAILGFMGYGKAPLPILLISAATWFGVTGLVVSALLKMFVGISIIGWGFTAGIVAGSGVWSLFITGRIASFINRALPSDATTTRPESSRKGETAMSASTISDKAGQIEMEGRWMDAVVQEGTKPIPKGRQVLIIRHDAEHHNYIVEPLE
jgi:membrane protein implicated in regulation of membrane protease activity